MRARGEVKGKWGEQIKGLKVKSKWSCAARTMTNMGVNEIINGRVCEGTAGIIAFEGMSSATG